MSELAKILSICGMSGLKFITGPVMAIETYEFGFWLSFILCSIGGVAGVFLFVTLSERILKLFRRLFVRDQRVRKVFTWKNKLIVRTVRRFGLTGLAFITPLLLSIPLGSFLAVRYFHNRKQILTYYSISVIGWSGCLSAILYFII